MDDPKTVTMATELHDKMRKIRLDRHTHQPSSNIQHGNTTVLRTGMTAHREELFMQRSRDKRLVKSLREQLGRARRRHSKATPVPLDVLEALLARVESADV